MIVFTLRKWVLNCTSLHESHSKQSGANYAVVSLQSTSDVNCLFRYPHRQWFTMFVQNVRSQYAACIQSYMPPVTTRWSVVNDTPNKMSQRRHIITFSRYKSVTDGQNCCSIFWFVKKKCRTKSKNEEITEDLPDILYIRYQKQSKRSWVTDSLITNKLHQSFWKFLLFFLLD